MDILPIARALLHRKLGAVLIGLQMVLSVAILANAVDVIHQRLQHMQRPTGLEEARLITLNNSFTGSQTDLSARIQGDLAQLRAIPGVEDAAALFGLPLHGGGQAASVGLAADQKQPNAIVAEYMTTDRAMRLLGLKIVAGRAFAAEEIHEFRANVGYHETVVIVSQALALKLFPKGDALGKNIYLGAPEPGRIVGIVERAQAPWASNDEGTAFFSGGAEYTVFQPVQAISADLTYVVRAQPGQLNALVPIVERTLYSLSRERIVSNVHTFAETRAVQYRGDRSLALVLTVVCALMLAIAGLGVIALTTYWVAQRRRQIGMRRALGASWRDILAYFHTENLLIAGSGTLIGVAAAYAGNLWLVANQGVARMGVLYLCITAAAVLGLSQLAVLWPALRAAGVSPAAAIRGQ
jgi:putative ABC transport system permease protein